MESRRKNTGKELLGWKEAQNRGAKKKRAPGHLSRKVADKN
jgi:hypothetical protein